MNLLPAIVQETAPSPDASIIWLHGLGASGYDFSPIVPELKLPEAMAIRFIFPHAPRIPVTINNHMVMPAWYDILEMEIDRKVDFEQLSQSTKAIARLIENECEKGIDSSRIIIAGFSQGGAVAYDVTLSCDVQLGGLLAMSTYFATEKVIQFSEANVSIPIEIQHGVNDPVVPEHLGKQAHDLLQSRGYATDYKTYPMEHGVCPEQIEDISAWFQEVLTT
ncbi:alpha/beta hydrolase [Desulfopila sp. IMCC35008]|uniref:alpha/beta hydrolase n=1 Tax=Desulfopila sp. IMCC35008 TaxID=2653858 RepID=UPI0013D58BA2|nr:dienelactone hydrolase family protein [Desulfopila sp. IMCC35008]